MPFCGNIVADGRLNLPIHQLRTRTACGTLVPDRNATTHAECKLACCADQHCQAYQWGDTLPDDQCYRGAGTAPCSDDPSNVLWVGETNTPENVGCTNELALNYDMEATKDNGSCTYSVDPHRCLHPRGFDGHTAVQVQLREYEKNFSFTVGEWPEIYGPFTHFGDVTTHANGDSGVLMVLCLNAHDVLPLSINQGAGSRSIKARLTLKIIAEADGAPCAANCTLVDFRFEVRRDSNPRLVSLYSCSCELRLKFSLAIVSQLKNMTEFSVGPPSPPPPPTPPHPEPPPAPPSPGAQCGALYSGAFESTLMGVCKPELQVPSP
eukprot:SAG11_NODE_2569_length_3213_cov_1.421002_2_plen_322_part_00